MRDARCSCGFTEAGDETMTDHLLAVFAPEESRGADGVVLRGMAARTCSCGVATTTPAKLDAHFLAMFTPRDATGRDGVRHAAAPENSQEREATCRA
jgi:hypothetical protein